MTIIDSQVHAYEANTPKRPWHTVPNWPAHVTGDEMVAAMDTVGVDGANFISTFDLYKCDASRRRRCRGRDSLSVFDAAHRIAIDPPCESNPSPMSQSNGNCTSRRSRIDSVTASVHSMYFTAETKSVCVIPSRPRTALTNSSSTRQAPRFAGSIASAPIAPPFLPNCR